MADDKQVEIVIRAKNLTDDAFKKVQAAVREVGNEPKRATDAAQSEWSKWCKPIAGGTAAGTPLSRAFKKVGRDLINLPNQSIALGDGGADARDAKRGSDGLS